MSIGFDKRKWQKIEDDYSQWWAGKLSRPLIPIKLKGRDPKRPKPLTPLLSQATCHDLTISPEAIIDRIDYELSTFEYHGDAFPIVNMAAFGPGVVAAFLGAELTNDTGRVWFHPKEIKPIEELHFTYDPNNIWLNRIKDIYRAGMDYWDGEVLMGLPDMGGALDILSTFRPADALLLDLYDSPDEVKRLTKEIHELWMRYYDEFNEILQPINPGYSDWGMIYSAQPSYIPQSDFSYMLSPDMFAEFALPELLDEFSKLTNSIYHLDGVGQLNHLDFLLKSSDLKAIQWVPGAGQAPQKNWPTVLKKILDSDKGIFLTGINSFDDLDEIISIVGTKKGLYSRPIIADISEKDALLQKYTFY